MDVVQRYDIDGVHFDDYFYPYPVANRAFPDDSTFMQFADGYTDKYDWRRYNVDLLIKTISDSIKAVKPFVKFGISPFGVWKNQSDDPWAPPPGRVYPATIPFTPIRASGYRKVGLIT